MSSEKTIEETIPGEWWWLAVLFDYEIHRTSPKTDTLKSSGVLSPGVYRASLQSKEIGKLGSITITGDGTNTHIRIHAPARATNYWQEIIARLQRAARFAQRYKRSMIGPIIDQLLDRYYRLREAGSKVTLKQLATEGGVKYSYLRKRKIAYDRRVGNKIGNKNAASER